MPELDEEQEETIPREDLIPLTDPSDEEQGEAEETAYRPPEGLPYRPEMGSLSRMYRTWFLDYASYVILERAVPHIDDGLKPVQRRILYNMKKVDTGKLIKVANIVGETMKYHPHGDASINDALVQLGQKGYLIDTQGNWGNILTGDAAAAGRYIEAKLSVFALEAVFSDRVTPWKKTYDGTTDEPVALPVKFPLLLAQGAEGIAVGLSSKILSHNFVELAEAACAYLRGESFTLYPDFPTGGMIDVTRYNDGERGGSLKSRAKIDKLDSKTLSISELPAGKTTTTLIESILKAVEKGKIRIRRVDDMTAATTDIRLTLAPGVSSDKAIDALYAFTDCEVSISPNCCIIDKDTPRFVTVKEVLKSNVENTKALLKRELEIRRGELLESMMFASLERIFIDERIYKDKAYENAANIDAALAHIDSRLEPFKADFVREVVREDLLRLLEIKMARILKFNKAKADELIARIKAELALIEHDLAHLTEVTIDWFTTIYDRYAAEHPRRTEIRSFDTIEAAKVVEANEKLYVNRADGFMGTSLKKDEFVENCSNIDDVIIFYRDGTYKVTRVAEKVYIGETERSKAEKKKAEIVHIAVFKKNDQRTVYNVAYRDGKDGAYYVKRFNVTSITHDREYDVTQGAPGSKIHYFTANPNGEAEVIKVTLKPNPKLRRIFFEKSFSELAVKGRGSRGNLLTRLDVHKITLKSHGASTLGGRKVWFDYDVQRLNFDERGDYLGEFHSDDMVLVVLDNGDFYTTNFDPNNHYESTGLMRVEKFDETKVWTAVLYDADNDNNLYIKRFNFERASQTRHQNFMGDNPNCKFVALTDQAFPRFQVSFAAPDDFREPLVVDAEEFIAVKGFKAKGKRMTTFNVAKVEELEPTRFPEPPAETNDSAEEDDELQQDAPTPAQTETDIMDDLTGQLKLGF